MLQLPTDNAGQLLKGAVETALQVRVSHHQDALLVPGDQADLFWDASIQLQQKRCHTVRHHTGKLKQGVGPAAAGDTSPC